MFLTKKNSLWIETVSKGLIYQNFKFLIKFGYNQSLGDEPFFFKYLITSKHVILIVSVDDITVSRDNIKEIKFWMINYLMISKLKNLDP